MQPNHSYMAPYGFCIDLLHFESTIQKSCCIDDSENKPTRSYTASMKNQLLFQVSLSRQMRYLLNSTDVFGPSDKLRFMMKT